MFSAISAIRFCSSRILNALEEAKGLVGGPTGAAARLGLKRTTLQSRMRKYNIARQFQ